MQTVLNHFSPHNTSISTFLKNNQVHPDILPLIHQVFPRNASNQNLHQHLQQLAQLLTNTAPEIFQKTNPHWRIALKTLPPSAISASKTTNSSPTVLLSIPALPLPWLEQAFAPYPSTLRSALPLSTFCTSPIQSIPIPLHILHQSILTLPLWTLNETSATEPSFFLRVILAAYKQSAHLSQLWTPQLPPWFEPQLLQQWITSQLRHLPLFQKQKNQPPAHPFQHHLLHSLLANKAPTLTLKPPANSNLTPIRTTLCISPDLIDFLWTQQTSPQEILQQYPSLAQKHTQLAFEQHFATLLSSQTPVFLASMGVATPPEWTALLWSAFQTVCKRKYDPLSQQKALQEQIQTLLRSHLNTQAALRCQNELPSLIKDYYPLARQLNRTITVILGPTNSGKTYDAIQALSTAPTGTYLGPLRLLALEIYDKLNDTYHVPTSLITGEQVILQTNNDQPATHTSSTIEMLNYNHPVDTLVIDEIQLLQDPQRGSAWLHAILGAPAKNLYLIGSPEAQQAVTHLLNSTNEPYTLIHKERLSDPLQVATSPAPKSFSPKNLPPASALIAFSRKNVLAIAEDLKNHGRNPAVIYGSLPPDVRRKQSELFASGQADVLVATDAVGLGLNLPISRIYFTTSSKWNGVDEENIDPHLVWQIAGRAGRYGMHETGFVSAFNQTDLAYLQNVLSTRPLSLPLHYYSNLTQPIAEKIAKHLNTNNLSSIYTFFLNYIKLLAHPLTSVKPVSTPDQQLLASILDKHPTLTLSEKLLLSNAPAISRDLDPYYLPFISAISSNTEFNTKNLLNNLSINHHTPLTTLEANIKTLNLWCWMHYRFEHIFLHAKAVQQLIHATNTAIHTKLSYQASRTKKAKHRSQPF